MALGQFQTTEDLFQCVAWKIIKHYKDNNETDKHNTSSLQW